MEKLRTNFVMVLVMVPFMFLKSEPAHGQSPIKMKTTSIAYSYKENGYNWANWSDFEPTSILVLMDLDKERITVYSKETQIYDIAKDEGKTTDSDGDDFYSFLCVNEGGKACRVRLAKLNSQGGRNQLYVKFDDMKWVYNLRAVD